VPIRHTWSVDVNFAPRLRGDGIELRALSQRDVRVRATIGRHREVARGFGGDLARDHLPMTEAEAADELRHSFGPGPHWAIADDTDTLVGTIRLAPIDVPNRSARLGIGIYDPGRLALGLGSAATRTALSYGFGKLGLNRVNLTVLAGNDRAIAAYRKVGFRLEGGSPRSRPRRRRRTAENE